VAGLGGGTLPTALAALLPDVRIDVVEIDPAVVKVARTYFDFQENERVRVHIRDARVFVKRALQRGRQYDLVILDAYSGDYIPEHLMTAEFLDETRRLLAPGGAVAANTFAALMCKLETKESGPKFADPSGAVSDVVGGGRIFADQYTSLVLYDGAAAPLGLLDWYEYPFPGAA